MRRDRAGGARHPVLEKREGQAPVKKPVNQADEKPRHTFRDNMDAIAGGVEAWFEENTAYFRKVTETTVEIARALSVSEGEIKRWEAARSNQATEKGRVVQSLLARLPGSFPGADNREQ